MNQCEKHGKKEEALAKIRDGADFGAVAKEYSEDKARTGKFSFWFKSFIHTLNLMFGS